MPAIDEIQLSALKRHCTLTLGNYLQKLRALLLGLQEIDSVFKNLALFQYNGYVSISENLEDLEALVVKQVYRPNDQQNYSRTNEDGTLNLNSLSRSGWGALFSITNPDSGEYIEKAHGGLVVDVTSKGISIALPTDAYGRFHEFSCVMSLLKLMIDVCEPDHAVVMSHNFRKAYQSQRLVRSTQHETESYVSEQDFGNNISIGWVNYFKEPPGIDECLPGDIDTEVDEQGGVFIFTTRDTFNSEDPQQIVEARRIHSAMDCLYMSQGRFVFQGFPPDAAELRYEQYINGAPKTGVAYRIKCFDFSGWDADRKVLLYARLFPFHNPKPFAKELVLLAKHQLAVLDLAKCQDPIEWHIGIQSYAEILHQVFDEAGILDARLQVLFTPIDENFDKL